MTLTLLLMGLFIVGTGIVALTTSWIFVSGVYYWMKEIRSTGKE